MVSSTIVLPLFLKLGKSGYATHHKTVSFGPFSFHLISTQAQAQLT